MWVIYEYWFARMKNISDNKIPASLRANDINGNDKYSELLAQQILNEFSLNIHMFH